MIDGDDLVLGLTGGSVSLQDVMGGDGLTAAALALAGATTAAQIVSTEADDVLTGTPLGA